MPKIKVFVVEDDPLFANQLEMYIDELGYWLVGKADNAKDAIEMIAAIQPDLILMDVKLKEQKDGIDVAQRIQEFNSAPIIFITSMDDEATYQRIKSVLPIAFINKPVSKTKLKRTIELVVNQLKTPIFPNFSCPAAATNHLSVKTSNSIERIDLSQLIYIEVLDKQCQLTMMDRLIIVRTPLKDLVKKLPATLFLQTHRSFLANLQHIKSINLSDQVILMNSGAHIPLSRSYREQVLERLNVV